MNGARKGKPKDYVRQLAEVDLTKTQAEVLMKTLADNNRSDDQKFYRARDIVFEALVRKTLGDTEYSKLCLSAVQKARTVMNLVKERSAANASERGPVSR